MIFAGIDCQPHSISSLLCIWSFSPFIFQGHHCACSSNSCWLFFGNVHCLSTLYNLSVFLCGTLCSYLFLLDSCRENNPITAGVVYKINFTQIEFSCWYLLFYLICFSISRFSEISLENSRSLFYFLVVPCIMQFIVEMYYKIAGAVYNRQKCRQLTGIEVLINILGHRASVSRTSEWVYI